MSPSAPNWLATFSMLPITHDEATTVTPGGLTR